MANAMYFILFLSLICILLFSIQLARVPNGFISALGYGFLLVTLALVAYLVFFSILPISVSKLLLTWAFALVAIVITFGIIRDVLPDPSIEAGSVALTFLTYSAILIVIGVVTYFVIQNTDNKLFLSLIVLVAMVSLGVTSRFVIDWFKPSADIPTEVINSSAKTILNRFCPTSSFSVSKEEFFESECKNLKFSVQIWAAGPTMVISTKVFRGKIAPDKIDVVQKTIRTFVSEVSKAYKVSMELKAADDDTEDVIIQIKTRFRLPANADKVGPFVQKIEKLSQDWRHRQPSYSNILVSGTES